MANKSSRRKAENDHRIRKKLKITKHMDAKVSPVTHSSSAFLHNQKQALKKAKEAEERKLQAAIEAMRAAENKAAGITDAKPKGGYKGKKPLNGNKSPRK